MVRKTTKSEFKAGMYLLETLTAGMYNDPFAIYREYIQNSADSIDVALQVNPRNSKRIHIDLDPFEKSISILDKGAGIPIDQAKRILSSVGLSTKNDLSLRGFRGIGRLGGLAFCEQAVFRTKAKNEDVECVQVWDCNKLRQLMSGTGKTTYSLQQLFNRCTNFHQANGKKRKGSYFEVKLDGVQSFRNHVMDIKKLYGFLSVVAPVPFAPDEMQYADEIDNYLSSKLSNYNKYDIILNDEPVYKPYTDHVKLTSKGYDFVEGIEFFEININDSDIAYGWYGKRKDLLGAITKGELTSGIRVRVGNIQIGDNHLLDGCFRERRFNSYMVGEIHVDCADLIPNSRRDDFVDNEMKGLFYNEIERVVGLPMSKIIRQQSRLKSKKSTTNTKIKDLNDAPTAIKDEGVDQQLNDEPIIQSKTNNTNDENTDLELLSILKKECKNCPILKKITKVLV
jgi:hypothetical protein